MVSPNIVIAVATHKPYRMPADSVYLPLHVGAALHPDVCQDIQPDSVGNNISMMNAQYSELTGLWWIWKNLDAEYKGLVHYRRHFASDDISRRLAHDRFERIAVEEDFRNALKKAPVILPQPRNYLIETVESHYRHTMPAEQLETVSEVINQEYPAYASALEEVLSGTHAHIFNMSVMRADIMDEWCSWIFPLLGLVTDRLNPSQYDAFNARYPGRVSEWLLDVWLKTNDVDYVEMPTVSPESVNWVKKGSGFLAAKFFGRKYDKSF
jgi:hypothetical protein